MLSVQKFLEGFLTKWETSKHSVDPDDSGNYFKGILVGSKYGVTGAALAKHRGMASVTREEVATVTLAEAAAIARATYYDEAQFDLLPWGPVVASAVDKCYMSGEDAAVKCLQRAAGADDDGHIGEKTVLTVAKAALDQVRFAEAFAAARMAHEALVIKAKPVKAKYKKGWDNRTKSYLPGTPWWKSWGLDAKSEQPIATITDVAYLEKTPAYKEVFDTVSETASANVTELAKNMSRTAVTEVLAQVPATVTEHVVEGTKLKLGEKSTWIGGVIVVATTLADPTVQAAIKPAIDAVRTGHWGGLLSAVIGLGLILARSKATPRTDAMIAAKRLTGPG